VKEITISPSQMCKLLHMLGIDYYNHTRNKKNISYRNHWCGTDYDLNNLEKLGVVRKVQDRGDDWYQVTKTGIKAIEAYIGQIKFI
jgi:predicted transcriptional regulator